MKLQVLRDGRISGGNTAIVPLPVMNAKWVQSPSSRGMLFVNGEMTDTVNKVSLHHGDVLHRSRRRGVLSQTAHHALVGISTLSNLRDKRFTRYILRQP